MIITCTSLLEDEGGRTEGEEMKSKMSFHLLILMASMFLVLPLIACQSLNSSSGQTSSQFQEQKQDIKDHNQSVTKPSAEQVETLVRTEFAGLFQVDQAHSPYYVVGDFNGDNVEDIVVTVRLKSYVDPNDKSSPPFWFEALRPVCPVEAKCGDGSDAIYTYRMGDLTRFQGVPILIAIHGTPELGWINSGPQQKFVISSGPGEYEKHMKVFRGKLKPETIGDDPMITPPPNSNRDMILLLDDKDRGEALYWEKGNYHWYPVEELPSNWKR
jgi:hypothetical protein